MTHPQILAAVARADFGRPTAAKRGRDPRRPYVPIVDYGEHTWQVRGRAYETRAEAVACAADYIERNRENLRTELGERRFRALREQHGLPRELEDLLKPDGSPADS